MGSSLPSLAYWIVLAALFLAGWAALALRRRKSSPAAPAPEVRQAAVADNRQLIRSRALDALSEAVLITDPDGRVRDCNSSALTLFERDRPSIEDQFASSLRRFEGMGPDDPYRVAAERTIWTGEAWARQPDGSARLCTARVVATRDAQARVTGFVESYLDVVTGKDRGDEFRNLLYGVRAFDPTAVSSGDSATALQREVYFLSGAFRDLDLVMRQCERLLPSLSADDPLTEVVAGAAHDLRAAMAAVGMPTILEEVPRSLARVRGHLQQLAPRNGADAQSIEPVADGRAAPPIDGVLR